MSFFTLRKESDLNSLIGPEMHINWDGVYIFPSPVLSVLMSSLYQLIFPVSVGEKLFLVKTKIKRANKIVKAANLQ